MLRTWRGLAPQFRSLQSPPMQELLRSNDPVYLSFVRHVLAEAGIDFLQLDDHMAALEGSVGAIPRRIMVLAEDLPRARLNLGNAALTRK